MNWTSGMNQREQAGMTLVEVLVAVVLISVGLLGVAALQLTSLRGNQDSYARSQAAVLASDIIERMRANQLGFRAGHYDTTTGLAGTIAETDIARWQATIDQVLPGGAAITNGTIVRNGNIVTITVQWNEREEQATAQTRAAATLPTFSVRSEI
jgi:type IV pilus assembly protein PilV